MAELKQVGAFKILPAAPGTCEQCAVKHDPGQPHNQQSLHWQYYFFADHNRWPTWKDAMAHCSDEVKKKWIERLKAHNIIGRTMKIFSDNQKNILKLMRMGYELRINITSTSSNPTLLKDGRISDYAGMKTVTWLLNKKLIKHSEKFHPDYHYFVLSEKGKTIEL